MTDVQVLLPSVDAVGGREMLQTSLFQGRNQQTRACKTAPSCIIHPAWSLQEQDLYFTSVCWCDRSFMRIISLRAAAEGRGCRSRLSGWYIHARSYSLSRPKQPRFCLPPLICRGLMKNWLCFSRGYKFQPPPLSIVSLFVLAPEI